MLFFDNEARRAAFIKRLRQSSAEIRLKEVAEEELLKEALTREQRAQIVETFIRHAFSKVSVRTPLPPFPFPTSAEVEWAPFTAANRWSLLVSSSVVDLA